MAAEGVAAAAAMSTTLASATVCVRRHDPAIGPHLRTLRVAAGMSLREAASSAGISFAKLQKMETGGRFRVTSPSMLDGLAELYGVDRAELWRLAGFVMIDVSKAVDAADNDPKASAVDLARARGYQLGWDAAVAAGLVAAKRLGQATVPGKVNLKAVAEAMQAQASSGMGRAPHRLEPGGSP